ncbi:STAS domain-containing protein [Streptomyces sp. NPDC015346]|uniref:STAS domain-containing protein n=1 Tax=Streptomyces sp. NPDC015346 TaxID=3364954 RepID=UPI0037032EAA
MEETVGLETVVEHGTRGRVRVAVSGEIDFVSAPRLRAALDAALSDGARRVVVDFGEVQFCDCYGLSVLLRARRRARERGMDLRLVNVDAPPVRRLLELTETAAALLGPPATEVETETDSERSG